MHDEDTANEIWLPVVGYEGSYEVSDAGRVKSIDRWIPHKRFGMQNRKGIMLKPAVNNKGGHLGVKLCRHGKARHSFIHRLVLQAFVGPCPHMHECAHWDGDPTNNRLPNLRWATKPSNYNDRRRHGTDNAGSNNSAAVLGPEDANVIQRLLAEGRATQDQLAELFGVGQVTISRIHLGNHWSIRD